MSRSGLSADAAGMDGRGAVLWRGVVIGAAMPGSEGSKPDLYSTRPVHKPSREGGEDQRAARARQKPPEGRAAQIGTCKGRAAVAPSYCTPVQRCLVLLATAPTPSGEPTRNMR